MKTRKLHKGEGRMIAQKYTPRRTEAHDGIVERSRRLYSQNWNAVIIVTPDTRIVFDWKADYEDNYAEAREWMMFNDTKAKAEAWHIIRGSI